MYRFSYLLLIFIVTLAATSQVRSAIPNPKERIDFWQENYTALTKYDDKRVDRAYRIFKRIVKVAGNRPGVEPRLQIIKEDPHNMALPISIPDGWIILSKNVLDICYRDNDKGDSRLAFVLAHEIAHQLEDDFWHMKFFQAMQASQAKDQKIVGELQKIVKDSDRILAKELRADELGIIYTMMAGYDVSAIIDTSTKDSFFSQWEYRINPKRLNNGKKYNPTHPNAKQRVAAVKSRLQQVTNKGDFFNLGIWFYQAGDFKRAQLAFDEFRQYYPGREVYHNLASSWHQLAIQHYTVSSEEQKQLPFQLTLAVDPLNRASRIVYRSKQNAENLFSKYLNNAIDNYQKAIALDPEYLISYNNLASAWLLYDQPYKAIATLQDAEKLNPLDPMLLNSMGVAFYYAKNLNKARDYLQRGLRYSPMYAPAIFNLGVIAHRSGENELAEKYWQTYLRLDTQSAWAQRLIQHTASATNKKDNPTGKNRREKLDSVEVGTYLEELPPNWQIQTSKTYEFDATQHKLNNYRNGIQALSEANEIRILITNSDYQGSSARGIKIGDAINKIIKLYGAADRIEPTPQGIFLAYIDEGITFQTQEDKITGWLLYWD